MKNKRRREGVKVFEKMDAMPRIRGGTAHESAIDKLPIRI